MHGSGFNSLNPTHDATAGLLFLTGSIEGRSYVLHASGELDLSTRHLVEPACSMSGATNVIVDLSNLTFMDCSGYSGVEVARDRLETVGGTLTLRSARGLVLRLLDLIEAFDRRPSEATGGSTSSVRMSGVAG
jgi:anti-anti-sigma factor